MNEFDFRAYLKKNPLLKEGQQNYLGFAPGDDSFWDQVYDAAVSQFPEEAEAIEGVISRPSRVMQALEADGEVDEAVDYVLDSLELGEPKGMGDTQKAFLYNPTNQVGFNPMRNKAKDSFIQANRDAVGMPGSKMYEAKETKLFYVDLDSANFEDEDFQKELKAKKIKTKVVEEDGPGGGWPVIRYIADKKTLHDLVAKHWGERDEEQTELYADDIKPMKKGVKEEKEEFVGLYEDDDDYVDDGTPATDYGMRRRASDDSFIQAQRLAAGEPDEDDDYDDGSDYLDARERFLGLGGQEILDNIKFLVDDGFELEDIIKQIQQHANYVQSPTINEGMDDDDSENPFPSLNPGNTAKDDSFIQAQRDAAGSGGYVSDYYAGAPGISNDVKVIAANVDKVLNGLDIPEEEWINLSDLIIDLADAYADFRIDMYTDGQMD